jgi:hypothetical protein
VVAENRASFGYQSWTYPYGYVFSSVYSSVAIHIMLITQIHITMGIHKPNFQYAEYAEYSEYADNKVIAYSGSYGFSPVQRKIGKAKTGTY